MTKDTAVALRPTHTRSAIPRLSSADYKGKLPMEVVPIPAELGGNATYGLIMRKDKHRSRLLTDLLRLLGADGRGRS